MAIGGDKWRTVVGHGDGWRRSAKRQVRGRSSRVQRDKKALSLKFSVLTLAQKTRSGLLIFKCFWPFTSAVVAFTVLRSSNSSHLSAWSAASANF